MPFVASNKSKPAYDVIIVGSGAAGGQSAYVLAMAGGNPDAPALAVLPPAHHR